jgi:hypothetical protein
MKNLILFAAISVIVLGVAISFAQYTGPELGKRPADNLFPHAGPGDLMIVDQLKETNRLLQEQVTLLSSQNRILSDALNEIKKQQSPRKPVKTN